MGGSTRIATLIVLVLITAVAYFFAAKLALVFAIPPGYATAVWPAAGIALAALLKFGYRLWPGVLLGSFAANITVPGSEALSALGLNDVALPLAIASGATLQALIGRWLVAQSSDPTFALVKMDGILRFVMLIGFVTSLTSSVIGVGSLVTAGMISLDDAPFNWLNWWVGDSLGIILMTPLVYALFGQPQDSWGWRRSRVGIPLLAALVAGAGVFQWVRSEEELNLRESFADRTRVVSDVLERHWVTYLENLYSIRGLIQTNRGNLSGTPLRAGQFRDFVDFNLRRLPGVQALSWNPVVFQEQRARFEQDMDRQGFEQFVFTERGEDGKLKPAESREKYVVVQYIEPFLGNQAALGFDVYSNPSRRAAMDQARDLGQLVATEAITLVQETGVQRGVLVFLPVYSDRRTPAVLERRRESLVGFAVGVFRIGDVLAAAESHAEIPDTITYLWDVSDASEPVSLAAYQVDSGGVGKSLGLDEMNAERHPFTLVTPLDVGTRKWQVAISPTENFFRNERSWAAWGFLEGMLFVFGTFTLFLLSITGRAILEREERNALARLNSQLTDQIRQREAAEVELQKLATHDSLTGLSNRRIFDEKLREVILLAQRSLRPFTLLMIDLDHFKEVNDNFGHAAGDEVLRRFAELLKDSVRITDEVARYGGEEFVIILRDTGEREAVAIAQKIVTAAEQLAVSWQEATISVTTSIGVAEFPLRGTTSKSILEAADKALYEAKQGGRNQLRAAG